MRGGGCLLHVGLPRLPARQCAPFTRPTATCHLKGLVQRLVMIREGVIVERPAHCLEATDCSTAERMEPVERLCWVLQELGCRMRFPGLVANAFGDRRGTAWQAGISHMLHHSASTLLFEIWEQWQADSSACAGGK